MICHLLSESCNCVSKSFQSHSINPAKPTLSTHRTFALTCIRGYPVTDAMLQMISDGGSKEIVPSAEISLTM